MCVCVCFTKTIMEIIKIKNHPNDFTAYIQFAKVTEGGGRQVEQTGHCVN